MPAVEATMVMNQTEEARQTTAWVAQAQAGDTEAFARLMRAYSGFALALAARRLATPSGAEDVVQEAWIEAYTCLPRLREPAAFAVWFRRIILKHVDRVQRVRSLPITPLDDLTDGPLAGDEPEARVERDERDRFLASALAHLPSGTRDVIELFYLGDLSHAQIASALAIPVTTVKKRLHDGRHALRHHLTTVTTRNADDTAQPPAGLYARVLYFLALATGDVPAVYAYLQRYPDLVHARDDWRESLASLYSLGLPTRDTGLHRAAALGNAALARCLLDAGADLEAHAIQDHTPLHVATLNGWPVLVTLLARAGGQVNARTLTGMTPLHLAILHTDSRCVRALLAAGASPDLPDCSGRTPRDWARLKGCEHLFPRAS